MKEYILAIDLGTYCDHVLMDTAISELGKKYKIVYLTDKTHKLPDNYIKESFITPSFFINDPKIKIANTSTHFPLWIMTHFHKALISYKWSKFIKNKLDELFQKYQFKSICILYPALGLLWLFENIKHIPIYIFYYAPGILSKNIPWLFDSILKKSSYELYNKSLHNYNVKSGLKYLNRLSIMSKREETVHEILKSINHVICWDEKIIPKIQPFYKDLKIYNVGSLINLKSINKKNWIIDNKIINFIKLKKNILFMSFGTYSSSKLLKNIIYKLLNYLENYCIKNNYGLIYHNGGNINHSDNILVLNGFIPYEYIVPKSKLVIFTGSVCLQNICIYNCIPMLFLPLLNEQFYWAKNYKYFTNCDYINYKTKTLQLDLNDYINNNTIIKYLKKISNNMKKNNASNNILRIIRET